MSMRIHAGKASDFTPGIIRVVTAGDLRVAVVESEGAYYAVEDRCTHDDGPLGEGVLEGGRLRCPRHGALFDVRTGAAVRMPAVTPVRTFPVRVEGESVFVEVADGL